MMGLKQVFCLANGEAIIKSLLDTDYYKFPMAYFIWKNPLYREAIVTFKLIIRDKKISLAKVIPESVLREQLDECLRLSINPAECSFVGGMTKSDDKSVIIPGNFLAELRQMKLPAYDLRIEDGDYVLTFTGPWWKVTWWEIMAMAIVSELYYYFSIVNAGLSEFEVMTIYANMIRKLHDKIGIIKPCRNLLFALFDTRRRHSRYMQEFAFEIMRSEIPDQCVGSSSVLLSMKHGSANPIGTNAHELTMVKACLAGDDIRLIRSAQYEIVKEWFDLFGHDMSIMLPDTFGTAQFIRNAPKWMAHQCKGVRPDSMHPDQVTELLVNWWKGHDVDPQTKLILPSDGLDAQEMVDCFTKNGPKVGTMSFGWGTLAGNDCRNTWPRNDGTEFFRPFSMACKVVEANGIGAVKLSDNPSKATGPKDRVDFFKKIFGAEGAEERSVIV